MVLSVLVPVLLWWLLSASGFVNPKFLPTPIMVGQSLVGLWQDGYLLTDTPVQLWAGVGGFLAGGDRRHSPGHCMGAFASIRA
jgi:NitT/TauT family transport system permease protein